MLRFNPVGNPTNTYSLVAEPFLHRTRKLPCIFAALFVCYSSRSRLRDSLLRLCFDFLLFFTTQTRPVHRETDSGDEKFITPINKIHNPILGYGKHAQMGVFKCLLVPRKKQCIVHKQKIYFCTN